MSGEQMCVTSHHENAAAAGPRGLELESEQPQRGHVNDRGETLQKTLNSGILHVKEGLLVGSKCLGQVVHHEKAVTQRPPSLSIVAIHLQGPLEEIHSLQHAHKHKHTHTAASSSE